MDSVYVVNHIIKRKLKKKGGKVFGLKNGSESYVRQKELWKAMERRDIRITVVRIKEIYEGTESAVRVRDETSN